MEAAYSFHEDTTKKKIRLTWYALFETSVLLFAMCVTLFLFVAQPYRVRGVSMRETLQNDDYVLIEMLSYKYKNPTRGDIVVLHKSELFESDLVKRVIGVPGDIILIRDGDVFVNGELLDEPYLQPNLYTDTFGEIVQGRDYVVPENEYAVFGDNRPRSSDSRSWGTVEKENIRGEVIFRVWPYERFGTIPFDTPEL